MTAIASLSLSDRFSDLIGGLLKDVAAEAPRGWVAMPLIKLLWRRLRRMTRRFASVLARFHAGILPAPGSAGGHPAPASPASASHPSHGPRPLDLPRRVGWVVQVISGALIPAYELEKMLDDPELAATVAVAPQLGRVLRPLCRMMAVRPPAWLRLPRRRALNPPPPSPGPEDPSGPVPARQAGGPSLLRLGAGDLWRGPDLLWPTREQAEKFDAKIRV
jgi:hypothetical protein